MQAVYVGHPLICPPSGLYRAAWVCTDTAESAEKVVEALSKETEFLIDPITREQGGMSLKALRALESYWVANSMELERRKWTSRWSRA